MTGQSQPTTLFQEHCRKVCEWCTQDNHRVFYSYAEEGNNSWWHSFPTEYHVCAVQISEAQWLEARVRELVTALRNTPCQCPSKTNVIAVVVYSPTSGEIRQEKPKDPCERCAAIRAVEPEGVNEKTKST